MKKILIIAEAGVNHNGSMKLAKKLVDAAKSSGADIVKFQKFKAETLATSFAPKAKYQIVKNKKENQFNMLRKLELSEKNHIKLKKYCKKKNIEFLSSGFDITDILFLKNLNLKRYKIPSGEITNYFYLKKIASLKKNAILSTGMSTIKEIKDAVNILKKNGLKNNNITLLHCTTDYPAHAKDLNLRAIITLKEKFKLEVGYSDHSLGTDTALVAVGLGAKVIEKHITLNRKYLGPDHRSSLEPKKFKEMVNKIRIAEKSLGDGKKTPTVNEKININIVRKSIVAKLPIKKGEKFTNKNLTFKRPGTGISPMIVNKIFGKFAKKNFKKDEIIKI